MLRREDGVEGGKNGVKRNETGVLPDSDFLGEWKLGGQLCMG